MPSATAPTSPLAPWRRLPLAAQLAIIVVSVTLGWAILARTLTARQQERASAVAGQLARLEAATDGTLDLFSRLLDARGAAAADSAARTVMDAELEAVALALRATLTDHPSTVSALDRWMGAYRAWYAVPIGDVAASDAFTAVLLQQIALRRALSQRIDDIRADAAIQAALDAREQTLLRAAILAIVLLLVILVTRTVRTTLINVVQSAEALAAGQYAAATLPSGAAAPSSELQRLAKAFTRLSAAVAAREGNLQDQVQSLREIEQIKTEFVATVSHELRTPLTSIRGALGLMDGGSLGPVPPKALPMLRMALANTERLIRLINDILALEKADGAGEDAVADRVDVDGSVNRAVASLELVARERRVTLVLEARARAAIIGTEDRVLQAVTNLVANAIKFSPEGGTVRVETADLNGQVEIRVHDQGPGIPEEFRSRIFGRFQQALGTSGGTGLGLAITKRIAERLGGTVDFACPPSGGSVFTLRIPTAAADLTPAHIADAHLGPSILLVDPDASMRELLRALLVPNYAVIPAATLAEAAERLRDHRIVAAIIEPAVDDGEGLAFIQRLRMRDAYHDLPIVLFTADDALAKAAGAADIAASHVYRKSIDPEPQVARRVRAMLAARGIG